MFIKKKTGFVAPTEMFIKFHHSIDYQYTFLAIMKPFYEMAPFANGVRYSMEQLLFLVVENDMEGYISEYSDSAFRILKNMGVKLNSEDTSVNQRIGDVLPDLDFADLRKTRQERIFTKEIYEAEHAFDLSCFLQTGSNQHVQFATNIRGANGALIEMRQNHARAKVRVFEERYSAGILDLNVVCLAFVT